MSRSGLLATFLATMTVVGCGGAAENSATAGDPPSEVAAVQGITGDWQVTALETAARCVPAQCTVGGSGPRRP